MSASITPAIAKEAAYWLMLLHSDEVTEQDTQACQRWREESVVHEQAWIKALKVQQRLGLIPPQLGMETLDRDKRLNRRSVLKGLALVIATPTGYGLYQFTPAQSLAYDYYARKGQKNILLNDGTRVYLNMGTAINVDYNAAHRELILKKGEVLIETAQDPKSRPFFVRTQQGDLQPIGTRFLVRQVSDEFMELGVYEGAVSIFPHQNNASLTLEAGQQTRFSRNLIQAPSPLNQSRDAWIRGILSVQNMRLDDFIKELNRYRPGFLRCHPAVADLRISGTFKVGQSEQILATLPSTLPVSISSLTSYWVTIGPR